MHVILKKLGTFLALASAGILSIGCASVHIKKITPANTLTEQGLRFYRPRPYLILNKPIPVGGGDFFVYGSIDTENRIVGVKTRGLPEALRGYFPEEEIQKTNLRTLIDGAPDEKISLVPFDGVVLPQAGTKSKADGGKGGSGKGKPGGTTQPGTKPTTQATTQESKTGKTKASLQTSTEAGEPLLKLNDLFGIVYLPDFEEDYVVRVNSGLGIGSADLAMKYGWMIEHAKWDVDNTELGKFIYEQVQTAESVGLSFLNPAAAAKPAADALNQLAANQQIKNQRATREPPVTVLLRVRYVLEAEPGVYPILKPDESFGSWRKSIVRGQGNSAKSGTYDLTQEQSLPTNPVLLPMRPYTVAAYNYRRVIVIELANATPATRPAPGPTTTRSGGPPVTRPAPTGDGE